MHDSGGAVTVPGLRTERIADSADLDRMLAAAARARTTASTKCNEHSSRSHYVFRLRLCGHNTLLNKSTEGELNLIDLAGSERTKESGVTGAEFAEAAAINKSLSSLGDVISAMSTKAKHIPFRNAKLTHLLQNSLSGSAKTLMLVNVSPTDFQQSKSSLQFAAKTNGTEVGPAGKTVKKSA